MYRVTILANLKKNAPKLEAYATDIWADLDSESTIDALAKALQSAGHQVDFREANTDLVHSLVGDRPDICFNIAEGLYGDSRESQIPALLELLKIPYTGSKIQTHAISLDKAMTKRVWMTHGLRTSPFQVFATKDDQLNPELHFPLFVKPSAEGTGAGVDVHAIVHDEAELRERVQYVITAYRQGALVEPYLDGREFTIGIIGNRPNQYIFPTLEILTKNVAPEDQGLYTHTVKAEVKDIDAYLSFPALEPAFQAEINRLAVQAHNALNTLDVSRVDLRCDSQGVPYLVEINTLPGISPGISDLCYVTYRAGETYEWLINTIVNLACQRYGMAAPAPKFPDTMVKA